MAQKELFKNATYCHADVIDYYKHARKAGHNVICEQIRLMANVAAKHMDMHTQVYLTTHGRSSVAVIPFSAYEFRSNWGCDPSERIDYFKLGEVIHDIFAHFKRTRMCGFVLTSEYVGITLYGLMTAGKLKL